VGLRDVVDQGEAKARTRDLPRAGAGSPIEPFKDVRLLVEGDANAAVAHPDHGVVAFVAEREVDRSRLARKLHRVPQQVDDGLLDRLPVGRHVGNAGIGGEGKVEASL